MSIFLCIFVDLFFALYSEMMYWNSSRIPVDRARLYQHKLLPEYS